MGKAGEGKNVAPQQTRKLQNEQGADSSFPETPLRQFPISDERFASPFYVARKRSSEIEDLRGAARLSAELFPSRPHNHPAKPKCRG